MLKKRELLDAISECEESPADYHDCAKLATFYTLYDHLYKDSGETVQETEQVVGNYGDSDFLKMVDGCNAEKAWLIVDELMDTLEIMHPKVYESILYKLAQQK